MLCVLGLKVQGLVRVLYSPRYLHFRYFCVCELQSANIVGLMSKTVTDICSPSSSAFHLHCFLSQHCQL
jgi:hypothetical protein